MIVLDTSEVVALFVRSDADHRAAVDILRREQQPLVVPTGIMSEIAYVLHARAGDAPVLSFLESIMNGVTLWSCGEGDLPRVRDLMVRYADLTLRYADATVIACAERTGRRILTFDHRHFSIVARERTFQIIPEM